MSRFPTVHGHEARKASERRRDRGERPIFVVGCERSGTTLLRAMLNAHPNIAIPYEAERFSRILSTVDPWNTIFEAKAVAVAIDEFLSDRKVKFWKLDRSEVMRELPDLERFKYCDILSAIYRAYAKREGKMRWGDKTPTNTFDMPALVKAFPDAQFIHIVRDGRDVCLSWKKAGWAGYKVAAAAKMWEGWVWWADRFERALGRGRYYLVRYEDLICDPIRSLKGICSFLNETFVKEMLNYPKHRQLVPKGDDPFHKLLGSAPDISRVRNWKRAMRAEDVKVFEKLTGPLLVKHGYEVGLVRRPEAYAKLFVQGLKQYIKGLVAAGACDFGMKR